MMKEILRAGLAEWSIEAPEHALDQLQDFSERMVETNKVMNLTGITEPDEIAKKHFLDCIALLTCENLSGKRVIDVGCGAGFPGMPLKLVCPDCDMTLLDSLGKRIKFLQSCIDGMG
ncbi:MAG: 16S rRNA (guanine(527)-N(7))-methyltransferase RsmG, partial [Butyricicoccaceae bacterium]